MLTRMIGMGIRPQDIRNDRLFSPYVQTEIGKRQGGKGTGLGLALVRNIVQLSGGRLGLISKAGIGSIFWVEQEFAVQEPENLHQLLQMEEASELNSKTTTVSSINKLKDLGQVTVAENQIETPEISPDHEEAPATLPSTVEISPELGTPSASLPPRSHIFVVTDPSPRTEPAAHPRPSLTQLHSSEIDHVHRPGNPAPSSRVPRPFSPADSTIHASVPELTALVDCDSPLSILVVDDDLLTRRLMTRMITRLGHQVQSVENGLLALDLVRLHFRDPVGNGPARIPFDLVFLDNQMPVLSGVEMVTRARMEGIETMIVGVTGNAMKEDQDEYLECGADFVLIKPVMEVNVKQMIEEAKDRRRAAAAIRTTTTTTQL